MRFFYPIKETLSEIGCLKLYRTFGVLPFEILLRICPAALNGIICYSSCFFLFVFSAAAVSAQKEEIVTYAHFGGWRQHRQCQLHIHLRVLKTKLDFFLFFSPVGLNSYKSHRRNGKRAVVLHRVLYSNTVSFFFFFFFNRIVCIIL